MAPRHIIHVDMDAFYASIEQRDAPELRGRPVIVGGTTDRGVVAAASYEARRFGIHSAMPSRQARQLCPEAVFLRPRMSHYQAASSLVFEIFNRFTPLVEALSLDEAFLDVTGCRKLHGSPEQIGRRIKQAIATELELVASVGLAPNKFLAKLASDHDKPDGFHSVDATQVLAFLDPMPIERMWGIGRKAAPRFRQAGIATIGQLRQASPAQLSGLVGRQRAAHFARLARGEDERPVVPDREDKSLSAEVTLERDLDSLEQCRRVVQRLSGEVGARLRRRSLCAQTIVLKIRTANFVTVTRSITLQQATDADRVLFEQAAALLARWWGQQGRAAVRLLGVGGTSLQPAAQTDLFGGQTRGMDQVRDSIVARFGGGALRPATQIASPMQDGDEAGTDSDRAPGEDPT